MGALPHDRIREGQERRMTETVRKVCIDDPRMTASARKLTRAILSKFAKREHAQLKHVIELFEHGFLKITSDGRRGFYVELCEPENAPQLRSELSFETGCLS